MFRQWYTLAILVLIYIPVAIDATVLHVAVPSLTMALEASGNELLWISDIYSLVMAGMVLPMGALGDRIGYKRLTLIGSKLFGIASLAAAFSSDASQLIAARALLAVGAAMIVPATLAGIRSTFNNERERGIALGIWVAVGAGGAAFGPLVGGILLEHYYWGSVFLINVPIIALVLLFTAVFIPRQPVQRAQTLNLTQALMLIAAILLLVLAAKTSLKVNADPLKALGAAIGGALLMTLFIRSQLRARAPMIDLTLFTHRIILTGVVMALTAMIALVGFELLMAQELQFVHGFSPLDAGLFMLPLMLACSFSGPAAGALVGRFGLRTVATLGMAFSALSFFGLSMTDMAHQRAVAWGWMILLGLSASTALLSSTAAIMSAAPKEKATAAGAIETMAYELGAGMGIAVFGMILSHAFSGAIELPQELPVTLMAQASASINEALLVAQQVSPALGDLVVDAANQAFKASHSAVLTLASGMLLVLTLVVWFALRPVKEQ
ncbi:SmvA family efflux MFS transporter [Atlantibacter hermannii]|uniref:Putative multidrug resistance protein n=2 Tax=Atlantibacter hermannii TaxID=565 RepID=H5V251_ATLHE|nr:SmvA family efflux MFS transporter [Atlantibacter hermannii]MDU7813891.1 SmvA family efflux MFS transporter [Atlantibacter hermannii]QPS93750.1 SmvA family efflux MFS transporter [Atlantibacter hermannii]GAB52059.1 putative multidrug resistance protein [Atlantibacter hermannii NBRC 105704]VDZ73340.1 putative transport protein [Atlantibacter hermannii]